MHRFVREFPCEATFSLTSKKCGKSSIHGKGVMQHKCKCRPSIDRSGPPCCQGGHEDILRTKLFTSHSISALRKIVEVMLRAAKHLYGSDGGSLGFVHLYS